MLQTKKIKKIAMYLFIIILASQLSVILSALVYKVKAAEETNQNLENPVQDNTSNKNEKDQESIDSISDENVGGNEENIRIPPENADNSDLKAKENLSSKNNSDSQRKSENLPEIKNVNQQSLQANSIEQAPENIVINEFMPSPSAGQEWVELFNQEVTSVDISGWIINDSIERVFYTIPNNTIILAGGFVVFYSGNFNLNNSGDTVRLLKNSTEVDSHHYSANPGEDKSIGRFPDGSLNWFALDTPSPEAPNIPNDITPPQILNPFADPAYTKGQGENVKISAQVLDDQTGVEEVKVNLSDFRQNCDNPMELPCWQEMQLVSTPNTYIYIIEGLFWNIEGVYNLEIQARDFAENISGGVFAVLTIDYTPPTPPQNLKYIGPGNPGFAITKKLSFSWEQATDINGITEYLLIIETAQEEILFKALSGDALIYTLTDAEAVSIQEGRTYNAVLVAFDPAENSNLIKSASVIVDTIKPPIPEDLKSISGDMYVDLTWEPPIDISGIDYYNIYRKGSLFVKIAGGLKVTHFRDTNVENGQTYYYKVTAVDLAGNESQIDLESLDFSVSVIPNTISPVLPTITQVGRITPAAAKISRVPVTVAPVSPPSTPPKIEGETKKEETKEEPKKEEEKKEAAAEKARNWPMIIAIIIAVLIVIFGVWYYWKLSSQAEEYPKVRRKIRTRKK